MRRWVKGMRDTFFKSLFSVAKKDKNIILISADTGAICLDEFKRRLKKQYINIGIAEQNMIGVATGLAMTGKIVYVYGIVPFVTMRCFEQVRVDLCCMRLPVTIISIGAGFDYSTLGPTHHALEDIALMRLLPGMSIYSPSDSLMAEAIAKVSCQQIGPKYIRLDRTGFPLIYKNSHDINFFRGFSVLKEGKDLYIIATGRMVYNALQVAYILDEQSIQAGVIDLFRIKPLNEEMIWDVIKKVCYVVTLEEHFLKGGIGGIISETLAIRRKAPLLKPFGIPHRFSKGYSSRNYLHCLYKLDVKSVTENIKEWING